MNIPIYLVTEMERYDWVSKRFNLDETIFVGDGYYDRLLLRKCRLGVAPYNSPQIVKNDADFVTNSSGGNGVILEVALKILSLHNEKNNK